MIKAVFIGINKCADATIPELNGAKKDATALWALFSDTIPGLNAQLLIDNFATNAAVRRAVLDTLAQAADDDVVIISFAGHGSPDGHLVLYDTDPTDTSATALSMPTVADAFGRSRARAVLCILDCCFSGQAPSRVLEHSARPRSGLVFSGIHGDGRILLAACAVSEAAWEQPGTGHGLLTYAVIQALTTATTPSVQFPDVAGEIIRLTRVEANRIGVTQTPVFLGSVAGGLSFPILKPGTNHQAAFPGIPTRRLLGAFTELAPYAVPEEIIQKWTERFPSGLNELQLKAINEYGVLEGKSLLVVAPTSSGKTMVGELSAIQAVTSGKKASFLLPYRALVNEKFDEFTQRYQDAGLRVVRCSGDATDGVAAVLSGRYDLGFFTYEMFLNLALLSPRLLSQLGLVVLDEGQFITDPNRGITVELILSLLLRARNRGINPQLIVLSAVIGDLNSFERWLGLSVLRTNQRPVPLVEGVLDRRGTFQFIDVDGTTKTEQLLSPGQIIRRRDKPSSQDLIVPLVKHLVALGERLIIFRNMRGPAQGCARYLADELALPPATTVIDELPTQDLTAASADLRHCLRGGTAFHSTNLLRPEREAVERGFRKRDGDIHVLAATTTVAAGINTPASTVILAENEFLGEDGRPFTVAEYKNMAGRAGRLGFNETGKAIILADTPLERARLFQRYVLGTPENVVSSFHQKDLPTWTLRLLSQVRGVRADEIPGLLINTFGGYSASLASPQWVTSVGNEIKIFVNRLISAGLAESEGDIVHLTLLGRACGASSLKFESALRLVEIMRSLNIATLRPESMLGHIQVLEELDTIYTPVMKRGRSESIRADQVSQRYGPGMVQTLQRYCGDEFQFWGRCKRATILWDWIEGCSVDELERRFTTNAFQGTIVYGDIIRIADGTRFHLRSAHQILSALFPMNSEFLESVDKILLRVETGLPEGALPLMKLRQTLSRGQYLSLFQKGCTSVGQVSRLSRAELEECVGRAIADKINPIEEVRAAGSAPI